MVSLFHCYKDELLIKFHLFNAEQMIREMHMPFSDDVLWDSIVIVCATLEILGCSSMQTRGQCLAFSLSRNSSADVNGAQYG
jgi:hypothetical protein